MGVPKFYRLVFEWKLTCECLKYLVILKHLQYASSLLKSL